MKIAVFGASVSHQTKNHTTGAITGYAEALRRDHAAALGAAEIRQITYAGNRLSDGGLLRLADVVLEHPGQYVLSLTASNTAPDYAQCRRDVADWPKLRYLKPISQPVLITDQAIGARLTRYEGALT